MANPLSGEVALGEFTMVFNFGTFCELEERTGRKTQNLLEAMSDGLSFSELRDFVWAGLQARHPDMTDAAVLQLLNEQGYEVGGRAVGRAVSAFFGDGKAKAKNPRKAAT